MGLRDKMNQNPAVVGGITGAVLLLALIWIVTSMGGGGGAVVATTKDFYSNDDGVSYFVDEAFPRRVPPFDKDGKLAYRAHVWTCDGGQTKFVSALQRFPKNIKDGVDGLVAANKLDDPRIGILSESWEGSEVKAPKTGDTPDKWIKADSARASALLFPTCPGGGTIQQVQPTE